MMKGYSKSNPSHVELIAKEKERLVNLGYPPEKSARLAETGYSTLVSQPYEPKDSA